MKGRCCSGSVRWCWPCSARGRAVCRPDAPFPVLADGQRRRRNALSTSTSRRCRISACRCCCRPLTIALGVGVYLVQDPARRGRRRLARRHRLGTGPRLRPGAARPAAGCLRGQPHRPERPARHLHDGHLHRHRAGAAGADGAVRRMARLAGMAAASTSTNGRCSPSPLIGLGAVAARQQPADGDRLARHPGFCGGAAVHAARRARPVVHAVHDRDAVGGHPGAGDDAAEAVAGRPPAGRRAGCRRHRSRLPAGSASGCCCSR